jgi:hypothetical protein
VTDDVGSYCVKAYDWIDNPSASDLEVFGTDANGTHYRPRAGVLYSVRLTVTPNSDAAFLGFHTDAGHIGLGNCWIPVTPGEK